MSATQSNGLKLRKISTPIGVIVIIYESRPNVTADAASLCFKSGNSTILRGGKEALNSNQIIARVMVDAARKLLPAFPEQRDPGCLTTDREGHPGTTGADAIRRFVHASAAARVLISRGGLRCSKVPSSNITKGLPMCLWMTRRRSKKWRKRFVMNAKVQRQLFAMRLKLSGGIRRLAKSFLPRDRSKVNREKVELRADPQALSLLNGDFSKAILTASSRPATDQDFFTEYNDYILNVRVVDGLPRRSTISIITVQPIRTASLPPAKAMLNGFLARSIQRRFIGTLPRASPMAESSAWERKSGSAPIRLGARGPMGLEELTSYKGVGIGNGQVRN